MRLTRNCCEAASRPPNNNCKSAQRNIYAKKEDGFMRLRLGSCLPSDPRIEFRLELSLLQHRRALLSACVGKALCNRKQNAMCDTRPGSLLHCVSGLRMQSRCERSGRGGAPSLIATRSCQRPSLFHFRFHDEPRLISYHFARLAFTSRSRLSGNAHRALT